MTVRVLPHNVAEWTNFAALVRPVNPDFAGDSLAPLSANP